MSKVRGVLRETFDEQEYSLRLTMRDLAKLQEDYGNNVAGLLDGTAGDSPPFIALLDLVSLAIQRGEKLGVDKADDLADEMLTEDVQVASRIIAAAFPDNVREGAKGGKPRGPKKTKA